MAPPLAMLTPDLVADYVRSTQGVRSEAARTIAALWQQLPDDPERAVAMLLEAMPYLADLFAEMTSLAASDFYNAVRPSSAGFAFSLLAALPRRQVEANVRWSVAPLFQAEPDWSAAQTRMTDTVDRMTTSQGHMMIVEAGKTDPLKPRFARVPVGVTCDWCRMLASRGAVYRTEATGLASSHAHCDCKVVPVFDGDALPYDPNSLRAA